jgi:hypothetical protein
MTGITSGANVPSVPPHRHVLLPTQATPWSAGEDNLLWDDLRTPLSSARIGVNAPTLANFRDGLYALRFDAGTMNEAFLEAQLPHGWAEGTEIRPHVHWSPGNSTNTGSVVWKLEYTWANAVNPPGNTWPASSTLTVTQAATGTAYAHQIADLGGIDGTGFRISSVLVCRLYRDASNAADTFTGGAFAISFDIHHQLESDGSVTEYPGA